MEGLGDTAASPLLWVEELPSVCSVEPANSHRCNELGVEVAKVDAVLAFGRWLKRLPMGDAPAIPATYGTELSVALNIRVRSLGMAMDRDGAELEIDPRATDSTAQGTVAVGSYLRR